MKLNKKLNVVIIIYTFSCFFSVDPQLSFAAASSSRDEIIQREFDCISQRSSSGNDLSWADVCYKSEEPTEEEIIVEEESSDTGGEDLIDEGGVVDEAALRKYQEDLREYRKAKMREAGIETAAFVDSPVEEIVSPQEQLEAPKVESTKSLKPERTGRRAEKKSKKAKAEPIQENKNDGPGMEWVKVTPPVDAGAVVRDEKNLKEDGDWLDADFKVLSGYRRDQLIWNIASDLTGSSTPNVLSELKWDPLRITQIKAQGTLTFVDRFVLDGKGAYGWIYDGDNQDSDYLGDDRTLEFSRSNNQSNDDDVFDITAGAGIRFPFKFTNIDEKTYDMCFTVMGGYSYHQQNLVMTDGLQTIPASGAFSGLRSTYETEWEGPWAGGQFDVAYKKLSGFFRMEYHDVDYYAQANWNLRTDFRHPKSFEHIAEGTGLVYSGGVAYHLNNRWRLNAEAEFQDWETEAGLDRTFFANGTSTDIRLNEVRWESLAVMLGLTYSFF